MLWWMMWQELFGGHYSAAHSELCWLLNCATPIGWLEKMIQFKEKVGLGRTVPATSSTVYRGTTVQGFQSVPGTP